MPCGTYILMMEETRRVYSFFLPLSAMEKNKWGRLVGPGTCPFHGAQTDRSSFTFVLFLSDSYSPPFFFLNQWFLNFRDDSRANLLTVSKITINTLWLFNLMQNTRLWGATHKLSTLSVEYCCKMVATGLVYLGCWILKNQMRVSGPNLYYTH